MYTSTWVPRTCCHPPRNFILWLRSLKSMQKTSGSKRSLTYQKNYPMKPSTTSKLPRNTNRPTPLCTAQRLALGRFLLRCHQEPWQRPWQGLGLLQAPRFAGVATVCELSSVGFATASKRLERKVTKHEKIHTLALAKRNSVNELVSKALTDKSIRDTEFSIITREVEKYHELKAAIRDGTTKTQETAKPTQAPDLEKLNNELRKEVKQEFQRKISLLTAVSKSDLKD